MSAPDYSVYCWLLTVQIFDAHPLMEFYPDPDATAAAASADDNMTNDMSMMTTMDYATGTDMMYNDTEANTTTPAMAGTCKYIVVDVHGRRLGRD